jgi:ElaB/YqjD/DUF883 family membrane-anchored ribosome-binding protein
VAEDPDAIRREIAHTREEMAETIDAIEYKADVKSRARDRMTEMRQAVAERADTVLSSIRGTAQRVSDGAPSETNSGIRAGKRLAEDNPLLVAVGAAAAGFLIGMALPGTRMEDDRLGSTAGGTHGTPA